MINSWKSSRPGQDTVPLLHILSLMINQLTFLLKHNLCIQTKEAAPINLLYFLTKSNREKIIFIARYSSCALWHCSVTRLTANGTDSTEPEEEYSHALHTAHAGFAWYMSIFIACWSSMYLVTRPYALPTCISAEIHLVCSWDDKFLCSSSSFFCTSLVSINMRRRQMD